MFQIISSCSLFRKLLLASLNLRNSSITPSLSEFYTESSVKRNGTRKRPRPEFEYIRKEIEEYTHNKQYNPITILELGCGDGRFAEYIDKQKDFSFRYIGIDCSDGLIQIAKSRTYHNTVDFYVGDMIQYLHFLEQDSIDIIVSIASIQHLHKKQRPIVWNESYRVLRFMGKHISINRSYSKWMIKKHRKSLISGRIACILNRKTFSFGDAMIPFTEQYTYGYTHDGPLGISIGERAYLHNPPYIKKELRSKTSFRFYHFFRLGELKKYSTQSGLIETKAHYIDNKGNISDHIRSSRNSFVVSQKDIILP